MFLSEHVGKGPASALASRIGKAKGNSGRFYINECGEFFSPPSDPRSDFVYLGSLDDDVWFPPPAVPRP